MFGLTIYVLYMVANKFLNEGILTVASIVIAYYLTSLILQPVFRIEVIYEVFKETIWKDKGMFMYLELILGLGIAIVINLSGMRKFYLRKMFHGLIFFLLLPPIIFSKFEPPRFIALAINCVIAAMAVLELARYKRMLPGGRGKLYLRNTIQAELDHWLKSFCDGHEGKEDSLIASHIYLMIGSAFPFLQSYILLDGSVFPANWALWSTAGVIFLGIGDTFAALGGKNYGRTYWREDSKKT